MNETRLMAKSVTFPLSCFLSWIFFCYIYLFISVIVLQYHRASLRHKCTVICHHKFSLGTVSKSTSSKFIMTGWGSSWAGEARGKTMPRASPGRSRILTTGLDFHLRCRQPSPRRGSWTLQWLHGERRQMSLPARRRTRNWQEAKVLPTAHTVPWTLVAVKQP